MLKPLNAAPVNIFATIPDYILQKQNVLGLSITFFLILTPNCLGLVHKCMYDISMMMTKAEQEYT